MKPPKPKQADYFRTDISALEKSLSNNPENFWTVAGEKNTLKIFHSAAERVPAYKNFLKTHKISYKKIQTIQDFKKVPFTDKQNYIAKYPLKSRCWDGNLTTNQIIASSSGTTGNANYWPRSYQQEQEAVVTHELLFKTFFNIHKKSTLLIIGFPMGVYVSGIATLLPSWLVANKYPVSVISAGNNKNEVLKAIRNLYQLFEQVVFIGHPFFIKDVIETGRTEGLPWKKINLRLMFCSEGFTEAWREHLMKLAGIKNKIGHTLSTYGSSEMLLMAYETPLSILLKELAENKEDLTKELFFRQHTPNIFQYNPLLRYIETVNKELIFTSSSGIPLIRFNMHDSGVVIPYHTATSNLTTHIKDWRTKISGWPLWQLPMVALWGRSDHTIIFYAANIYPEHIHSALHQPPFLHKLTGKFTMVKGYYKNMDEFLEINIELRPKILVNKPLTTEIKNSIFKKLREINSEFSDASKRFGEKTTPKIKLWTYNHPKYFKPGLKPKYISY